MLSFLLSNNNTSNSSSLNSTLCHEVLFNFGAFSREANPSIEYGLCPDTYASLIVALLYFIVYFLAMVLSSLGVVWKRKSGHMSARSPLYMLLTMFLGLIFVVGSSLRFIISRKIYPCAMYSIIYFVFVPALTLPTIFRCFRVFFLYKLNLHKTLIVKTMENAEESMGGEMTYCGASSTSLVESSSATTIQTLETSISSMANLEKSKQITSQKQTLRKEQRLHSVYTFLVSYKFILICYACVFITHLSLWLIVGGIEEAIFNQSTEEDKQRIFFTTL